MLKIEFNLMLAPKVFNVGKCKCQIDTQTEVVGMNLKYFLKFRVISVHIIHLIIGKSKITKLIIFAISYKIFQIYESNFSAH